MAMVRESICKIKNEKATRPSVLLSEMVKSTGESGIGMITELIKTRS